MVLLGADPHPPFPPLPRRGGQAVKERGASCEGEGGKLERRGGQAGKAMGGKPERGKVFYLNFTSAYIPILR